MDEEPSLPRRLAAILAADIAGYSRLMHADEAATVRELQAHQSAILPLIGRHGGRIIDTAGDGIMAEFPSVIGATECAVESQTVMAERNAAAPESQECAELAHLEVAASDQCSSVACRGCRRAEREQGARRSHGKADGLLLVTATTLSSSTGALRRG